MDRHASLYCARLVTDGLCHLRRLRAHRSQGRNLLRFRTLLEDAGWCCVGSFAICI